MVRVNRDAELFVLSIDAKKSLFANWTNLVFTELNSKFQHTKVKVKSEFFIVKNLD